MVVHQAEHQLLVSGCDSVSDEHGIVIEKLDHDVLLGLQLLPFPEIIASFGDVSAYPLRIGGIEIILETGPSASN